MGWIATDDVVVVNLSNPVSIEAENNRLEVVGRGLSAWWDAECRSLREWGYVPAADLEGLRALL